MKNMQKLSILLALCVYSLISIIDAQEKKCEMHEKICALAKDEGGQKKFAMCFQGSAPAYFRDITNNCKKENGLEKQTIEELIVKICSEDEEDKKVAKKIGECKKAGMKKEAETNKNMKMELEVFMKCLG